MSRIRWFLAAAMIAVAFATTWLAGAEPEPLFDVQFSDCVESIGIDLIPTEIARALVPDEFELAGEDAPVTPIVVRTARCAAIAVQGKKAMPGTVVQIGALIVPPDVSGDVNIYAFWYYTSDEALAEHLQRLGMPAQHVPNIDYDFGRLAVGKPSRFSVNVPRPARPTLSLDGFVTRSATPAGSFEAIWWMAGEDGFVRMDTTVPEIFIGGANLGLETNARNRLGQTIGGDSLEFPILQQFNTFSRATMEVSVVSR